MADLHAAAGSDRGAVETVARDEVLAAVLAGEAIPGIVDRIGREATSTRPGHRIVVAGRSGPARVYGRDILLPRRTVLALDQVASGPLALTITDPDRGFVGLKLTLAPGEARTDLALVLQPMVEIHGRLIDGNTKQPPAGQIVLAESADSVVHPGSFYDDFNHTTAADGTFRFMAPVGDITVSSFRLNVQEHERCQATLHDTIDGPTDVGDLELVCKKL